MFVFENEFEIYAHHVIETNLYKSNEKDSLIVDEDMIDDSLLLTVYDKKEGEIAKSLFINNDKELALNILNEWRLLSNDFSTKEDYLLKLKAWKIK